MGKEWRLAQKLWVFCGVAFLFPMMLIGQSRGSGGTLLLINDSNYILSATIQAANGSFLGEMTAQPGQQSHYTPTYQEPTNYTTPGSPSSSLTPYTVIWVCPSEGIYSLCSNVSPGSLVRANGCPGYRYCKASQSGAQ